MKKQQVPIFILPVIGAVLLLTSCGMFSSREVTVSPASEAEHREYFIRGLFTDNGISFETENFLRGNLIPMTTLDDLPSALKKIRDYHDVTGDAKYFFIAADLCNGVGKRCENPEDAIRCRLAALYYFHERVAALNMNGRLFDTQLPRMILAYNESCNGVFNYLREHGLLNSDSVTIPDIEGRRFVLQKRQIRSTFAPEAFTDFSAASDYSVRNLRLQNYHFGVGVPLVGRITRGELYKSLRTPPGMTVPLTFLTMLKPVGKNHFLLYPIYQDTLQNEIIMPPPGVKLPFRELPLALDFSTPLAVFLDGLTDRNLISSMLRADDLSHRGLYMIEPYNPDKIPVVFVHGLMSSPGTWVQLINGLKNDPVIRQKYQFWFFSYSSGMPVIISAKILHEELMKAYKEFAVDEKSKANFEKTVIVGHSMGGLLTRTLVQKHPDYLVSQVLGEPWEKLSAAWTPEEKKTVGNIVLTPAVPFVHRVVFMAVPHRGSQMAQWSIAKLGISLIDLPANLLQSSGYALKVLHRHAQKRDFVERVQKHMTTGIDNLDPENPFVQALGGSPLKDDLVYHSIIGDENGADQPGGSDGVVPYWSSHMDGAASEWVVKSNHSVHRAPSAGRELQRILLLHLRESGE